MLLLSVVVTVTLKPFGCCRGNPVLFLEPVMKRRSEEDEEAEFLLPLAAPWSFQILLFFLWSS